MTPEEAEEIRAQLLASFGAVLDAIDEEALKPGEPSLCEVIANHAKGELKKLRGEVSE